MLFYAVRFVIAFVCIAAWPGKGISLYPDKHIFVSIYPARIVAASERTTWKKGRNTLQPWVTNSLTLNLIVCQKRQLNQERISLLKRKAQHRRKRIQRKKQGKVITQRARFTEPGFFLPTRISLGNSALEDSQNSFALKTRLGRRLGEGNCGATGENSAFAGGEKL
jgi:hypothetical protein